MNQINKEQLLFLVTIALLGILGYMRFADQVSAVRVPRSKVLELEDVAACPDIQFLGKGEEKYFRSGRNIFEPPQDWLPLEPLRLNTPPAVNLDPIWPFSVPSLGEAGFNSYSHPFGEVAAPEVLPDEEETVVEEGAGDTESEAPRITGITIDTSEIEIEDPDAALMKNYDWIRLNESAGRIFGQIMNGSKYDLLDPGNQDPVELRRVITESGKFAETFPYPRERVHEFGFAETVENLYQIQKKDIVANAAHIGEMLELAEWCRGKRDEEPEATDYAVEMVEMAVSLDPLLARAHLLLADIYEEAFDLEGVLETLKRAMACRIQEPGIYVRYGHFLERYGLDGLAEKAYGEALQIDPSDAEALMALGDLDMKRGDYDSAFKSYDRSIDSSSEQVKIEAILKRGISYLSLGSLTDAGHEAGRAILRDEENWKAHNLKGCVAFSSGELAKARESFEKALELEGGRAAVLTNLGATLLRGGEQEEAVVRIQEAVDGDPFNSSRALTAGGFAEEMTGDTEAALAGYLKAVEVAPDDPIALYHLGRFRRISGDPEEAEKLLRSALAINGRIAAIIGELGHACLDQGKFDDAAFYLRELAGRGVENFRSLFLQGLVQLHLGIPAEAEGFLERAVDRNNKTPEPLNGLAVACYRQGKVKEAMTALARVVRLFPEDSTDPSFLFALQTRAAIEAHGRKSQWIDRFQRNEIKNEWVRIQRSGPAIKLIKGEIVFKGTQRQGQGGEMTALRREISGKQFRQFEAEITSLKENQGIIGIFMGQYRQSSAQEILAQGEVRFGINSQGVLVQRVVDQGRILDDWMEIEGIGPLWNATEEALPGETGSGTDGGSALLTVKLGLRVADYETGRIELLVDDSVVAEVIVKKLRRSTRDLKIGVFGEASGGRLLHFTTDFTRIVKTE